MKRRNQVGPIGLFPSCFLLKRKLLPNLTMLNRILSLPLHSIFIPQRQNHSPTKKCTIQQYILKETCISHHHLTPELKLHLITPDCKLWKSTNCKPFEQDPFWGFYWPGGQSLTRFILDNGALVEKKRVLDFGCGCGASGLGSMKMRAKSVLWNDIDEVALAAVEENARLNSLEIDSLTSRNLIGDDCSDVDVVLVGDMLYDSEFANDVLSWLVLLVKRGKKVLLGDPGRFPLASHPTRGLLKCLAKYSLPEDAILENNGFSDTFVWEIANAGR